MLDIVAGSEARLLGLLRLAASTADGQAITEAVVESLLGTWRPAQATLRVPCEEGRFLELVGSHSTGPVHSALDTHLPVDAALPVADCFRSGVELSVPLSALSEMYPLTSRWIATQHHMLGGSLIVLPVMGRGSIDAVLSVTFPGEFDGSWRLRAALETVCAILGLWLLTLAGRRTQSSHRHRDHVSVLITERQRTVLDMVERHLSNAEIAELLGYSEATIRSDLRAMYRLFDTSDRFELVKLARKAGLLT